MYLLLIASLLVFSSTAIHAGDVSPQSSQGDGQNSGDMEGDSVEEYGEVDEDIIIQDDIDSNDDEGVNN